MTAPDTSGGDRRTDLGPGPRSHAPKGPRPGPPNDLRAKAAHDPRTGALDDPRSGTPHDLRTGAQDDPRSGTPHDLRTGALDDPRSGTPRDLRTGGRRDLWADAVAVLDAWDAPSAAEEAFRGEFLRHLDVHEDAMWRECVSGHITATTAVLSHDGERVLLTLHPKAGMWLPMGGHCERCDASVAGAALREATEESGIPGLRLLPGPLALDRHKVWCHPPHSWHLDLEYGALAPPGAEAVISDESLDLRWFPIEAIPDLSDDATRRLARRARETLLSGRTGA